MSLIQKKGSGLNDMNIFLSAIVWIILAELTGALLFWVIGGRKVALFSTILNSEWWKILRNFAVGSVILYIIGFLFLVITFDY